MRKNITKIVQGNNLKVGEEFLVKFLIGESPVKFIKKTKDELIAIRIWENKGEEIIKICKYRENSFGIITAARYSNLKRGEKDYSKLYEILK